MENISKKIRMLRLKKGWTQKFLAKKVGVSQTTICRAEISCNNIKWLYVVKILSALKNFHNPDFSYQNFLLQENEFFIFMEELKKHEKVWILINYDPLKTVKVFVESIEKNFDIKKNN